VARVHSQKKKQLKEGSPLGPKLCEYKSYMDHIIRITELLLTSGKVLTNFRVEFVVFGFSTTAGKIFNSISALAARFSLCFFRINFFQFQKIGILSAEMLVFYWKWLRIT